MQQPEGIDFILKLTPSDHKLVSSVLSRRTNVHMNVRSQTCFESLISHEMSIDVSTRCDNPFDLITAVNISAVVDVWGTVCMTWLTSVEVTGMLVCMLSDDLSLVRAGDVDIHSFDLSPL